MIPELVYWIVGLGAALFAASVLALRSYARFAARARGPVTTALPRAGRAGPLDALYDPLEADHPGLNGLANLIDHDDAFAARIRSARMAVRSLDLVYYLWRTDTAGWLLIGELIAAADRGVRVRLLLDDVNVQGLDLAFLGLNQHPNIEVRLFNPLRNRGHALRRGIEFALGLPRFNRRLHGKAWIADGRLAILGGRNIGDTYFGAHRSAAPNSLDADVMLVGPKVAEVEAVFDSYWNLGLSLPIVTLWPRLRLDMRRFRRRVARHLASPRVRGLRTHAMTGREGTVVLTRGLRWTAAVTLLADPADKAFGRRSGPWISDRLDQILSEAQTELRMVTPYFVPGTEGLRRLVGLCKRGVGLQLLTNALAVTDLRLVHGAYARYRAPLIRAGARLFEFAPPRRATGKRDLLHSKIVVIDRRIALVGSHNFDLRSAYTNIELGLLFEEPALVAEILEFLDRQTAPDLSYGLSLERGRIVWRSRRDGVDLVETREPEANPLRLLVAWVIGKLPLHHLF